MFKKNLNFFKELYFIINHYPKKFIIIFILIFTILNSLFEIATIATLIPFINFFINLNYLF